MDDDAPTLGGLSGSAVAYTESAAATQLESGLTVADTDDDDLEKAIVRISAGFETGEDELAATVGSTGLTATYTASTGTLEITGTGTKAEYQEVLRTVTYDNTNDDDPSTSERLLGNCLMVPIIHLRVQRQLILRRRMIFQQLDAALRGIYRGNGHSY